MHEKFDKMHIYICLRNYMYSSKDDENPQLTVVSHLLTFDINFYLHYLIENYQNKTNIKWRSFYLHFRFILLIVTFLHIT